MRGSPLGGCLITQNRTVPFGRWTRMSYVNVLQMVGLESTNFTRGLSLIQAKSLILSFIRVYRRILDNLREGPIGATS